MVISSIKKFYSNGNALAKNSAILFVGAIGAGALNYVFHFVVGRMVTIEDYGKIESLISFANIILIPTATITMIITRYGAGFKAREDKAGSNFFLIFLKRKILFYGLLVFSILFFLTPNIGKFLKINESLPLIIIWLLILLSFLNSANSGMLRGWQKFKRISLINILGTGTKLISGIILIKIGFAISGAIGSIALGATASYIASTIALRFIKTKKENEKNALDKIELKDLKSYIVPFFIGNLAINILGNIDMVLAKHNLGSLEAGQYGALNVVSKVIFFATSSIAVVLFSMSSENHHKKTNTSAIFKNAYCLMSALAFGGVVFYFIFPEFILSMLYGNKYGNVAHYLGWFAIMVLLFSSVNLMFQYLLSIQKTKIVYFLLALSLVFALAVLFSGKDIYAILKIGITIQAIGVAIGFYFLRTSKS